MRLKNKVNLVVTSVTSSSSSKSYVFESSANDLAFKIGETVYLKTDPDLLPRIITGIMTRPYNRVLFCLNFMGSESYHYDFEITIEND